ncbi:MAG: hypothetical protein L3J08_08270 [Flavobacteriaceae bacterium]|nr:hypothetical protein [Flavobacteriaceae bacterium]
MRLIFVFLTSTSIFAQNISGRIFENEIALQYVSITNTTQNSETFSDDNGLFTIEAIENDTLLFSSAFYIDKKVLVTNDYFGKEISIQLEQKIYNLDEIIISNYYFDEEQFSSNFHKQIVYDVDHNMQAYEQPSNGNVDFVKIFKRINKLVSKKKDKKKTSIEPNYMSYSNLKLLLLENDTTNEKLTDVLKIQEENVHLFIDFCRGKIKRELLEEKNNFLLLDKLIDLSIQFKKLNED